MTTMPVGTCSIRTAVATLFLRCPPGPPLRNTVTRHAFRISSPVLATARA
jgi:hypothetical protein